MMMKGLLAALASTAVIAACVPEPTPTPVAVPTDVRPTPTPVAVPTDVRPNPMPTRSLTPTRVTPPTDVRPTPTPTRTLTPTPEPSGACSPVDLSTLPELLRLYARGVACIEADRRQGTGFVVRNTDSGEGYLLTNAHVVVGDPTAVSAQLENVAYSAEVVYTSVDRDLAMVRICCGDFVVLKRNNRGPRFGESVMALGFQHGELAYSHGILRTVEYGSLNTYLEHTADIQPGDSGGPLLAFPFEAVMRAVEGEGLELQEGESLSVLGVTVGESSEYRFSTYAVDQYGVRQFVDSAWGTLGLELTRASTTPQFTIDW